MSAFATGAVLASGIVYFAVKPVDVAKPLDLAQARGCSQNGVAQAGPAEARARSCSNARASSNTADRCGTACSGDRASRACTNASSRKAVTDATSGEA